MDGSANGAYSYYSCHVHNVGERVSAFCLKVQDFQMAGKRDPLYLFDKLWNTYSHFIVLVNSNYYNFVPEIIIH